MTAETANTTAPQDGCSKKLTIGRKIYFSVLILLHSTLLGIESLNVYTQVNDSPESPTVEGSTEWEICAPLGVWSVSWRFILNVCGVLFAIATLAGGTRARVRIVAHSMLAYAAWFMAGPFLLYTYAAECSVSAPGLFRGALENYAIFTFYALFMMFLFSIAAFKGIRKARAMIKARKEAEAAAKAAQEAAQIMSSEKAPILAVPEGELVDVKAESLV